MSEALLALIGPHWPLMNLLWPTSTHLALTRLGWLWFLAYCPCLQLALVLVKIRLGPGCPWCLWLALVVSCLALIGPGCPLVSLIGPGCPWCFRLALVVSWPDRTSWQIGMPSWEFFTFPTLDSCLSSLSHSGY